MVTKSRYEEFMRAFADLAADYGISRSLPVKGQSKQEQLILNRPLKLDTFHERTHGTYANFRELRETGNIKLLWARMSSRVREYDLDPLEVAEISPDFCPVNGSMLDYGYGLHQVTDNPYFRPGIDHIQAVGNGGAMLGDIKNIQIVCQHFNTIKNYGTEIDAMKWLLFESLKYRIHK